MKIKNLLLTLLLLPPLMTSCAPSKKVIGVFGYNGKDTFSTNLSNKIIDELKDDYTMKYFDAEESQLKQNRQIVSLLNQGNLSALIINMVDRLASATIIQKAKSLNIPIIFYNREPVASDIRGYNNIYYVGTSPKVEGENQAEMAKNLLGDPTSLNPRIDKNHDNVLQCVFIRGEQSHQDTEVRTTACINKLIDYGYQIDILDMEYADWSRSKGYDVMETIYDEYGKDIEFVFSNNDDMALGAIDYLLDQKIFKYNVTCFDQPFPIVGVDGTDVGLQAVANGFMYGTTINDAISQAKAVKELIDIIDNKKNPKDFSYEIKDTYYIYIKGKVVISETPIIR